MTLPSARKANRQGSAVLVLLALVAIAAVLAVSNQMALRRLSGELRLLERRQQMRHPRFVVLPAPPVQTNQTNVVIKP